ncbi:hypothetical protein CANMA_003361 [Candida margitis]|uniref:uncharacterized protein n=1 Tax=Candida margitis TaxID=1775924 RepID=UPI002227B00D|nr:uncharacterized protein CANMA_003361 [Candida margitis]KAI5966115.1 hypothetical protein CANMA_003361 [Candida margitis]
MESTFETLFTKFNAFSSFGDQASLDSSSPSFWLSVITIITAVYVLITKYNNSIKSKSQSHDDDENNLSSTNKETSSSSAPPPRGKSKFYDSFDENYKIHPVEPDFQWSETSALKSYPFKNAAYKLTMSIATLHPQDWLLVEPTYLNRLENKKKILNNCHPDYPKDKNTRESTLFMTDEAYTAVVEFYELVMNYMCDKYPTCFERNNEVESEGESESKSKSKGQVKNLITGKSYPLHGKGVDGLVLQEYLTENIEEDFIILQLDPEQAKATPEDPTSSEYFFKAGVFAFAAGFNPLDRFNKPLTFIHERIPGYTAKLRTSMNKFFNRIQPHQFVTRSNWSLQTHSKFYVDDSNKGHNLPADYIQQALDYDSLDFENDVHYRSERQVLTRLPKSKAIVFTIRTYLLPLAKVKSDGMEVRQRLIGAIRGLPEDISRYKRAEEWGPPIIKYLEEEED